MKTLAFAMILAASAPAAHASQADTGLSQRYQAHDPDSRVQVDYSIFSHILDSIIYDVGPSDRRVARGRLIETGSRINRQSTSDYRYEGNRIWFHLLNDEHKDTIHQYRLELEQLPAQVDLADLSRNEQLAYWLNLHNAVLIDEIARAYPVRYTNTIHVDGERLFDAPIIDLPGGSISLNQLRNDIVLSQWSDPRVLYGFYTGAIAGPSIQERAFTGAQVWRQLDRIGEEFVNALRGVEGDGRVVDVSAIYHDHDYLFPNWPEDLRRHLLTYANGEVEPAVRQAERFGQIAFDTSLADLTHGTRCGGGGFNPVSSVNVQTGERDFSGRCDAIPAQAANLIIEVRERRQRLFEAGRLGRVTLRDIPTEDPDEAPSVEERPGQPVLIRRGGSGTPDEPDSEE